jgi:hypothetical protein
MSQTGIPLSNVVSSVADWKRLYQCAILQLDPAKVPDSSEEESRDDLNYAISYAETA